jgi:hypothetical protein
MIEQVVVGQPELAADASKPQVACSKHEPVDSGVNQSARAHDARFERGVESDSGEAIIAERAGGAAKGEDLGVSGGILGGQWLIETLTDDLIPVNGHGSHGNFPGLLRAPRQTQRRVHPPFIVRPGGFVGNHEPLIR